MDIVAAGIVIVAKVMEMIAASGEEITAEELIARSEQYLADNKKSENGARGRDDDIFAGVDCVIRPDEDR